jgi:DNA polymerase III subunit beta
MKFKCTVETLKKEIQIVQDIVTSRNSLSLLSNILFSAEKEALTIMATDGKLNFKTKLSVSVLEEGTFIILFDKLFSILNSLPDGEIEISYNDKIIIKPLFQNVLFTLKQFPFDKFPSFLEPDIHKFTEIKGNEVKKILQNCVLAISTDEERYFMNGVFIDFKNSKNLIFVSTDGKRLAYGELKIDSDANFIGKVIIPQKIINIIIKYADTDKILIGLENNKFCVLFNNYFFSTSIIDGQFPNYQKVIPENNTKLLIVNRIDLLFALKRLSILIEQNSRKVIFLLTTNSLCLKTEDSDLGNALENINCEYTGEEVTFAVNYKFIEEPLKVIEGELIKISFSEPTKAIVIKGNSNDYYHVIMPMQL